MSKPFALWTSPMVRAYQTRSETPAAIGALQKRPFSKPKAELQPGSGSPLKTAQICLFTGSNTPYESHE